MADIISELGASIVDPLVSIWNGVINIVPGLLAAVIILIVGYLIALLLAYIVEKILEKISFDRWVLEKTNLQSILGKFRLSNFLAVITKWYVFILFLPPAAGAIQLTPLAYFLLEVARWVPNVIIAVILGLVGIMAAEYVSKKITDTRAKAASVIGGVAKVIIIIFAALIVLDQIGVKVAVAQSSFLIILAGVMLAIALMLGIGFGNAFKDEAKQIIKDVKRKL